MAHVTDAASKDSKGRRESVSRASTRTHERERLGTHKCSSDVRRERLGSEPSKLLCDASLSTTQTEVGPSDSVSVQHDTDSKQIKRQRAQGTHKTWRLDASSGSSGSSRPNDDKLRGSSPLSALCETSLQNRSTDTTVTECTRLMTAFWRERTQPRCTWAATRAPGTDQRVGCGSRC